jgi:hypothetical protein
MVFFCFACALSGKHVFVKVVYKCEECNHFQPQGISEFMQIGVWPASPSLGDSSSLRTIIDESVFKTWDAFSSNSPGTSLQSYLRTLEQEGLEYGVTSFPQVRKKISRDTKNTHICVLHDCFMLSLDAYSWNARLH